MLEMGRPNYVCTVCSEHFTRKYSGKRHNQNLHSGAAEIVRLIDYLAGRSSGQYKPDNPFWYKRNNPYDNVGSSVADSVGNTFQPRYLPQQAPLGTSQYSASPTYRPLATMDDQSFGTGLSQETTQKIDELKRLVYKYRQYQNNDPDEIVRLVVYYCINGDNRLLDDKLEQLRNIESLAKY
jgi:hypothetical protein